MQILSYDSYGLQAYTSADSQDARLYQAVCLKHFFLHLKHSDCFLS